jgi:hypothetical protein
MKQVVKISEQDLRDIREFGFIAINNTFCLVLNEDLEVSTWPGAGGTHFSEHPELEHVKSGDEIQFLLPDGTIKLFTMPYHL